jgi:hypothetical protein
MADKLPRKSITGSEDMLTAILQLICHLEVVEEKVCYSLRSRGYARSSQAMGAYERQMWICQGYMPVEGYTVTGFPARWRIVDQQKCAGDVLFNSFCLIST